MYTARTVLTDGSSGPYAIGFDYLDGASIKAYLLEGSTEIPVDFIFHGEATREQPSGTAIVLTQVPLAGLTLRIRKEVDLRTLKVDWKPGASFSEDNLRTSSINVMEMAQTAYDVAATASQDSQESKATLASILDDINVLVALADTAKTQAQFWAGVAENAGSTANPEEAATVARDAAVAARDAAIQARNLAQAAQVLADSANASAQASAASAATSQTLSDGYANASKDVQVTPGKYSARHYAETAQAIVDAGALKWNGSAKFVSTQDPDPTLGVNGDFWFKREP